MIEKLFGNCNILYGDGGIDDGTCVKDIDTITYNKDTKKIRIGSDWYKIDGLDYEINGNELNIALPDGKGFWFEF